MEPAGFALMAEDASVVSGLLFMFHKPGVFIQRLDSKLTKKNSAGLGTTGAAKLPSASYLATILCRKDEADYFS